jgi:hypothetical protein
MGIDVIGSQEVGLEVTSRPAADGVYDNAGGTLSHWRQIVFHLPKKPGLIRLVIR